MMDPRKILGVRKKRNSKSIKSKTSFRTPRLNNIVPNISITQVTPPKQKQMVKKNYTIEKVDRETLDGLAKRKVEFGGGIDFNNRGVERIQVYRGTGHSIILPEDYEVGYHTHPIGYDSKPSADDIAAISENRKQQAEIILSSKNALFIRKTPKSAAWYRANKQTFQTEFNNLRTMKQIINYLKNAGFQVVYSKRGAAVPVRDIAIKEYSRFW